MLAEEFVVKVFKRGTQCITFDHLRVWSYYQAKCTLVEDLPLTSKSIRLHILRSFYVVFTQINCLIKNIIQLDPCSFRWKEENELLLPERVEILFPLSNKLVFNCTCNLCSTKSCSCVSGEIPCCSFCHCKRKKTCKN